MLDPRSQTHTQHNTVLQRCAIRKSLLWPKYLTYERGGCLLRGVIWPTLFVVQSLSNRQSFKCLSNVSWEYVTTCANILVILSKGSPPRPPPPKKNHRIPSNLERSWLFIRLVRIFDVGVLRFDVRSGILLGVLPAFLPIFLRVLRIDVFLVALFVEDFEASLGVA